MEENISGIELYSQKPLKNEVDNAPQEALTPQYAPFLNAVATNQLAQLIDRPIDKRDAVSREGQVTSGALTLRIEDCQELLSPRISVLKLFDMCCLELTRINNYRDAKGATCREVSVHIDRYLQLCGLENTKHNRDAARKRIKADLSTLKRLSIVWEDPKGGENADYFEASLCEEHGRRNGVFYFKFSERLANYLVKAFIGDFPLALFSLDDRNKHAYRLSRKLAMHYSIDRNRERGTAGLLSVPVLLKECPYIPTYEKVQQKDRAFNRRIMEPLENTLNTLQDAGILSWEFSNAKGAPLTKEQLDAADWKTFNGFYVKFEMIGAPSHAERLQLKEERRAKKPARKRKSTPKAPTSEI